MSATYTTKVGLGIPSLNDTDYATTVAATSALLDAQNSLGAFAVRPGSIPPSGLTVNVAGGVFVLQDGTEVTFAATTISLAANATNYLYLDSAGTLFANTTGFPASVSILPLAAVTCGASSVTLPVVDARRPYRASGLALSGTYLALAGGTMTGLPTLSGTGNAAGVVFTPTAAPGAAASGQVWHDSTTKGLQSQQGGIQQGLGGTVFRQTADATVASTAAETTLVGTGRGTVTIPANRLSVGETVRIRASGILSTTGSPTAEVKVKLGTAVLTCGAVAPGTGVTNVAIRVEAEFTCRAVGATGSLSGQAVVHFGNATFPAVATATFTVDTTGTLAVALTLTWSASSASNAATVTNLTVELLN